MVGIAMSVVSMSISIVSIGSISGGLGISGPLAIVVAIMVGIWVSIISMVGISISMVGKSVSVSVESISTSLGLSSSSGLGISRPLAIVVSMVGIWVSIVSMVTIVKTSVSRCISLASSSGEHAQGNNSNGFNHLECLQARGLSQTPH